MYRTIMVALDGSPVSKHGLAEAIRLAAASNGRIHAVYVVDRSVLLSFAGPLDPDALLAESRDRGRRALTDAEHEMAAAGVVGDAERVETDLPSEAVAERLERCARQAGADLAVLGTHGRRGIRRMVLGSVAERFLRVANCPVLMVPAARATEGDA